VTLGEAFAELGVAADTRPDLARRAYLRLLKTRKPEADPDGFRRLREAYEIVRATGGRLRPMVTTPSPPAPPPGESAVSTEAGPAVPGEEPREATPPGAVSPPVEKQVHEFPPALAPLLALQQALARGEQPDAARRLTAIYAEAARNLDVPTPPPHVALELMLASYAAEPLDEAYALDDAFRGWLDAGGQEVRVLGGLSAPWALLKELRSLPRGLSAPVRAVVATAIRSGEVKRARATLRELSFRNPAAAAADGDLLRRHGGAFCKSLADDLLAAHGVPTTRQVRLRTRWLWLVGPVLVTALRIIGSADSCSAPPTTAQTYGPPPATRAATTAADSLVEQADRLGAANLAARGRGIYGALWTGDCATARYHADNIDDQSVPAELAASMRALRQSINTVCPRETTP
jgi:hypothetical protein